MKNFGLVLALAGMLLFVCSTSFAGKIRVVTNDDNCTANTSSIYQLDPTTGALTLDKVLQTGGLGDCGGFFSQVGTTVTQNPQCLFVYDGGTSDIATWQVRGGIKKVGNFSNSALNGAFPGGSVDVSPDGKFLYATYGGSLNVGAWSIGSDCSLTFIKAYVPKIGSDSYSAVKVTPSGKALLVAAVDLGAIEMYGINQNTGALNDLGFIAVNTFADCASAGCFPEGIDITKDNKVAIIGNASVVEPIVFTVDITPTGLTNAKLWNMTNAPNVENIDVPWMSAAAYQGSGPVYLSGSGFNGGVPGVITAAFSETGPTLTLTAATQITSAGSCGCNGQVQTTGNLAVVSEWFNTLQTFTINSDGTLTPTSQGPVADNNANGALSIFIFPETR